MESPEALEPGKEEALMHRYRAILIDTGNTTQERPLQIFGNDRAIIDDWANKVLAAAISPDAVVWVYQTIEQQVALVTKPKPETKPDAAA
jgi:hypothetical protein